jgi:hypothetical protein
MLSNNPRDSSYFPVMLICLFLVTNLGVPQSITLLNLLSIGLSSFLVIACVASFFFVCGASNYFFNSAIFFYFSVSYGSLLFSYSAALMDSWACLYLGLFWIKGTSLMTYFVGLFLLRSWSLQYSNFQSSLISMISSCKILVHSQLFLKIMEARIWLTGSPWAPPKYEIKFDLWIL